MIVNHSRLADIYLLDGIPLAAKTLAGVKVAGERKKGQGRPRRWYARVNSLEPRGRPRGHRRL